MANIQEKNCGAHAIEDIADHLYTALTSCKSIDAVSAANPGLDVAGAYAIQLMNVARMQKDGARVSGKKIGLTSLAMQQLLGVGEPDYGHLTDKMDASGTGGMDAGGTDNAGGSRGMDSGGNDNAVPGCGVISIDALLQPKVEGEVAFILKDDLRGPDVSAADVIAATEYVVAALEIVDSRIKDWKITLVDTVADNASSGRYVLSRNRYCAGGLDLAGIKMTLYKNNAAVNAGSGRDVLGNPANCVAWLANKLSEYGVYIKKGEVVLSGALTAAVAADRGDQFEARFSHLGSVSVRFD